MSDHRPKPPLDTDAPEDLAEHVAQYPSDWLLYLRNLNAYLTSIEKEKEELYRAQKDTEAESQGYQAVIRYQEEHFQKETERMSRQLLQAQLERERAIGASQPAVTALPSPAVVTGAKDLADPTARAPTSVATPPSESSRPSERLPDPGAFQGDRKDLRRFVQQIHAKMTANADRFPTAQSRLAYVAGRLQGRAYDLILPKINYGIPQFVDYSAMLEYLEQAFGDPDRIQNAQNKLYNLKQRNQDFNDYFTEFQRLALEGEMPNESLTPLLYQGISRELQDMLLHNPAESRRYQDFARHLQQLDNRYRQHQQQVLRTRGSTKPNAPVNRNPVTPYTTAASNQPRNPDAMDTSAIRPSRVETKSCFRCGAPDHFVRDCPKPDLRPTKYMAPIRGRSRSWSRKSRSRRSSDARSTKSTSAKGVSLD
jgi:hypothetical protein